MINECEHITTKYIVITNECKLFMSEVATNSAKKTLRVLLKYL